MQRNKIWIILLTVSIADAGTRASSKSPTSENIKSATRYVRYHSRKQIHRAEGCSCKHSEENFLVWILRHQKQPVSRSLLCNRISHIPEEKYKKQNTARHQKSGHLHDPDTKQGNTDTDQQVKQHRIGYDSKFCRTFTAIDFFCKKHGCAPAL